MKIKQIALAIFTLFSLSIIAQENNEAMPSE